MSKKLIPIKYTSRDYDSIREDLVNYAKRYYKDTISDFTENSFNSFMLDSVAYVGDILSYYLDVQANESFLATANQYSNIVKLGEELGYKNLNNSGAATGIIAIYAAMPANNGTIDTQYNPTLKKGSVFSTKDGRTFTLVDDVKVYQSGKSTIAATRFDSNNSPTEFAVKNYGKVISGKLVQKKFSIGNFDKFLKLNLAEDNVTEIVSVFDSEGHEYFEVDYLTQNTVYREMKNNNGDNELSLLRLYSVPRRFISQKLQNTTLLIFGGGAPSTEKDFKDAITEPSTFILDIENKKYFSDKYFDPKAMVNSDKLGIGPANTTLTVVCRVNTSENMNVSSRALNTVVTPIVEFDDPSMLSENKMDSIITSFEAENEEPIIGSVQSFDSEELKIRIKDNFAAQNRAVTLKDYEALVYSMPSKFGSVKRARGLKDIDASRRNINMYILSEDSEGKFIKSSNTLKNNLKTWIVQNKMIMDSIDILDAKIINLKIDYKIIGNTGYSKEDILFNSKQALINIFSRKPEIGEPLYFTDLNTALRKLREVHDIIEIKVQQKIGTDYSSVYFNVEDNISNDERSIVIPNNAIYEIKYPELDINGVIV